MEVIYMLLQIMHMHWYTINHIIRSLDMHMINKSQPIHHIYTVNTLNSRSVKCAEFSRFHIYLVAEVSIHNYMACKMPLIIL